MSGTFIALEGLDGVGKTSLAERLADLHYADLNTGNSRPTDNGQLPRQLVYIPRRQISESSLYAATLMNHLSTMLWHSGDAPDLSDAFWVSLQTSWFIAHGETVVAPVLEAGFDVIVDGWYYKLFAKLLLQGFVDRDLDVMFDRVREPNAVLVLLADPGAVFDRRRQFRPAELGMHAGYGELGRDTFIDYQSRASTNLQALAERRGWQSIHLDLTLSIQATVDQLTTRITDLQTTTASVETRRPAKSGGATQ